MNPISNDRDAKSGSRGRKASVIIVRPRSGPHMTVLPYLPSPSVGLILPRTYNPNARETDVCGSCNRLCTRTLEKYTSAGLRACMTSTISGPQPEATQDNTKNTQPVPGQKLTFLTHAGMQPRPTGLKAGTLQITPRRRAMAVQCIKLYLLQGDS